MEGRIKEENEEHEKNPDPCMEVRYQNTRR